MSFDMESYHSEKEFALSMGISGNYLGFSASASGSIDQERSETTVTAQFYQKMYEVVVEPPQTPGAFFSEAFTQEKLQEQVDLGKMGPDNLPVYVSNVVYGRMMMFSMTSTASEDDIRATLQAAYNGIGANVQGNLSAKQKTILSKAKISIASLGGDANASISMIKSGNWKDYFTESAALTSAAPLSYTFRNLGDGSIAKVTETTEYNIKECTAIVASPGVFNFPAETTFDLSDINMPVETFKADMNGDGREDLVFNHLSGNVNQIKIGLNNGMGGFDWTATTSNTEAIGSSDWQNYRVVFGDFDGDGKEDMVWSKPYAADNITYVGLSKGDGTFSFHPASHAGYGGWKDYTAFALDYDNDGSDELIWNELKQTKNHIYTSTFDGTTFTLNPWINLGKSGDNWNNYTAYVGQVNGGGEDLIFNEIDKGAFHSTYTASFNGNNFTLGPRTRQGINFAGYKTYLGNMGGNSNTDLIYNKLLVDHNYIHRDYAKSDGSFDMVRPAQELVANEADWRIFRMDVGDVSGDGYDDLIWSIDAVGENTNRIYVGLANSSGEFDFSPVMQTHPATAVWSQFKPLVLDVNGDGKKDVLWLNPGATTVVYQALSK
ncbi:MAG: thiol-activated cytolysin family protein [Bacteroidota bacterium]